MRELITTKRIDRQHRVHLPTKYLILCGLYEDGQPTEEEIIVTCKDKKIIIEKAEK